MNPELEHLIPRYRGFLVDPFGTLHDGVRPYPGAIEALRFMRGYGKVLVLSNSGMRAAANAKRLAEFGIPADAYDLLISSGELGWQKLRAWRPGTRVLLISQHGDRSLLDGLALEAVTEADQAELVVIAGSDADRVPMDGYAERLRPAAARGIGALCLNPARTMMQSGDAGPGAGRIAELYESLGGRVSWIGKPHPEIYRAALAALGNPPPAEVLAIGDSIEHDIAGAHAAGCAAALVLTGVAAGLKPQKLEAQYRRWRTRPDAVVAGLD